MCIRAKGLGQMVPDVWASLRKPVSQGEEKQR